MTTRVHNEKSEKGELSLLVRVMDGLPLTSQQLFR